MAINEVQQRKRRCGRKVKTGCGTCKIRKVKCDEARPSCQRCSKTGRKCDGYSSDIMISSHTSKNLIDLIHRIPVYIPGNAEEKRGFDFFLRNTAAELSGYYDSSFWGKLILAASAQKSSLRHAVIALGALHEDFSRERLMPSALSTESQEAQFALNQYAKALGELRRSLSSGKEEPLTALMSCILFVCFDSLRGQFKSAMVHLESGLRILRDIRKSSIVNHIIEDNIAPLFMRLSMQSIIYVEARSTPDKAAFARQLTDVSAKEVVISEEFESLEEARNALNQTGDGLFRAFYMWDHDLPVTLQSTESLAIFDKYIPQMSLWNLAFEKFMVSKNKNLTSREIQGAALLKVHHTTLKIMISALPDNSDTRPLIKAVTSNRFLELVDDFRIIINLSRPLIAAAEQEKKNGKSPITFSSDFGLVGPLYYVCINCPIVSIRTAAMELLLRFPRREGMWNSVMIAQMIQQFWELEAKHKEAQGVEAEIDEFAFPEPFTDRGAVHFAFFGCLYPAGEISAVFGIAIESSNATHQDPEAEALAVLEGVIAQEHDLRRHGMNWAHHEELLASVLDWLCLYWPTVVMVL